MNSNRTGATEIVPDIRQQQCPLGDQEAVDNVIFVGLMRHTKWRHCVPTEDFFHNGVDVGQITTISNRWETISTDDAVNFCLCFALHFGVDSESKEKGFHRRDSLISVELESGIIKIIFFWVILTVSAPALYIASDVHFTISSSSPCSRRFDVNDGMLWPRAI